MSLSDLKNKFYKRLPGLRDELSGRLVKDGFYTGRPDRVRLLYTIGGIVDRPGDRVRQQLDHDRSGHAALRGGCGGDRHQA